LSDDPSDPVIGRSRARNMAATAIARGLAPIPGARAAALVPVPIRDPSGGAAGWFVGVVEGDRLLGFVQLGPDLEFHRASTFGGPAQPAADWLDPARVTEIAAGAARPGERLGEPTLSYDTSPDRIGWIVPAIDPRGRRRDLMVTGATAFELRPGTTGGEAHDEEPDRG
jgi:hypothetical protein